MGVLVKTNWVGHFMALTKQLRCQCYLRAPDHGRGGAYYYVGSNLTQFEGL